ncbi:MAG: helix-turn-helix transcriptional regulator [Erysipelotrichia bacterium]|nr:helix-turn-helix transcriptional regulator [Erysipelotrichia bacterium]
MDVQSKEKVNRRHIGRNVQRVRMYFGVKQEALAADLGVSQSEISKIEQQDEIEEELLSRISDALGVSPEVIKDFDVEKAIYNINSYKDATIAEGSTTAVYIESQQINPLEKIIELYERLLSSEREKIELLKNK